MRQENEPKRPQYGGRIAVRHVREGLSAKARGCSVSEKEAFLLPQTGTGPAPQTVRSQHRLANDLVPGLKLVAWQIASSQSRSSARYLSPGRRSFPPNANTAPVASHEGTFAAPM